MQKQPEISKLKEIAKQIRIDILRMLSNAASGHTGGSLSSVEILISLYWYKLRHNPAQPDWPQRDRFILSKGHGCPTLYAVLAHRGFFPKEELLTLRKFGSRLQGHPNLGLPGVEISSGSLGQGLSVANGMALAAKLDKASYRTYCLMGDGEINEGQIWEAVMTAAHYKLDNICGVIDYNKFQIDGRVNETKNLEPLSKKWDSFGWRPIEVDGHNFKEIMNALDKAEKIKGLPTVVIAHTIKGKGVSFIEENNKWHGIAPTKEELERAIKELKG